MICIKVCIKEGPFSRKSPSVPFLGSEHGYIDKINHVRRLLDSFRVVYPQLRDLILMNQAPQLNMPGDLFASRDGANAMSSLVQSYYDGLEAPKRQ